MKFNDREAQRAHQPQPHQLRYQLGAVGYPQKRSSAETTAPNPDAPPEESAGGWFGGLMQRIRQWHAQRLEPKITATTDPSGHLWWQVYDPRTNQRKCLYSEAEVMRWLDNEAWF
ncbi:hypothetical protein IQ254_27335 [Nodosilinea sp. LEGE 07088]|uniref:hypothetical protein n=1 Tax=Nodosilinea sp. LEGE 07088 TaxID=2777968 RepID=UPI0018822C60|nr:hypothetical protein [Nodosilinea sp. LEGE 07088]MBE9140869.1 hypothetical protein [Nodosilinea sp. LEGE 07088]